MENKKNDNPGRVLREGTILDDGNGICIRLLASEYNADSPAIYVHDKGQHTYSYEIVEGNGRIASIPIYESQLLKSIQGVFVRLSPEQLSSGGLVVPVHSSEGRYSYEVYLDGTKGPHRFHLKSDEKQRKQRSLIDCVFSDDGNKFRAEMR